MRIHDPGANTHDRRAAKDFRYSYREQLGDAAVAAALARTIADARGVARNDLAKIEDWIRGLIRDELLLGD